jgi:hypothetical protein
VKNEVVTWLRAKAAEIHDVGIQLVPTLNKCLTKVVIMFKNSEEYVFKIFFTRFC